MTRRVKPSMFPATYFCPLLMLQIYVAEVLQVYQGRAFLISNRTDLQTKDGCCGVSVTLKLLSRGFQRFMQLARVNIILGKMGSLDWQCLHLS